MSSLEIPLYKAGWNTFTYPVQGQRPVADALRSIEGHFATVYGYDITDDTDPWKVYGADAPDWVNDLEKLNFGQGYWINVTEPITLQLEGNSVAAIQQAQGATLASVSSLPVPPATYYGSVPGNLGFAASAGMTVSAWVKPFADLGLSSKLCGQAQTREIDEDVWFAIDVLADDWGQAAGCGAPGRMVTFEVQALEASICTAQIYTAVMWNNDRVWELPGLRVYLPLVIK